MSVLHQAEHGPAEKAGVAGRVVGRARDAAALVAVCVHLEFRPPLPDAVGECRRRDRVLTADLLRTVARDGPLLLGCIPFRTRISRSGSFLSRTSWAATWAEPRRAASWTAARTPLFSAGSDAPRPTTTGVLAFGSLRAGGLASWKRIRVWPSLSVAGTRYWSLPCRNAPTAPHMTAPCSDDDPSTTTVPSAGPPMVPFMAPPHGAVGTVSTLTLGEVREEGRRGQRRRP